MMEEEFLLRGSPWKCETEGAIPSARPLAGTCVVFLEGNQAGENSWEGVFLFT